MLKSHLHIHVRKHARTHTHTHNCQKVPRIHTHRHTHTHTNTHTYTYVYIYPPPHNTHAHTNATLRNKKTCFVYERYSDVTCSFILIYLSKLSPRYVTNTFGVMEDAPICNAGVFRDLKQCGDVKYIIFVLL